MQVTDQFYAPATLSRAPNPRGHGDEETNSASSRNRTPSTSLTASRAWIWYSDPTKKYLYTLRREQLWNYEWQKVIKGNILSDLSCRCINYSFRNFERKRGEGDSFKRIRKEKALKIQTTISLHLNPQLFKFEVYLYRILKKVTALCVMESTLVWNTDVYRHKKKERWMKKTKLISLF